jgi:hypothetical protein
MREVSTSHRHSSSIFLSVKSFLLSALLSSELFARDDAVRTDCEAFNLRCPRAEVGKASSTTARGLFFINIF